MTPGGTAEIERKPEQRENQKPSSQLVFEFECRHYSCRGNHQGEHRETPEIQKAAGDKLAQNEKRAIRIELVDAVPSAPVDLRADEQHWNQKPCEQK